MTEFNEQQEHLDRVASRIAAAIIAFCLVCLRTGRRQFHAEDLRKFVIAETGISAPDSAGRIMRLLRQKRLIDYRVLNRRESFYEVIWVKGYEDKAA